MTRYRSYDEALRRRERRDRLISWSMVAASVAFMLFIGWMAIIGMIAVFG